MCEMKNTLEIIKNRLAITVKKKKRLVNLIT